MDHKEIRKRLLDIRRALEAIEKELARLKAGKK